jgi:protein ImuB
MFACVHAVNGVCDPGSLAELAYGFSPKVERSADDAVVLDITGSGLLFGPPSSTARSIARRAGDAGLTVNIAVAHNPDAAILAAKNIKGITIIPRGKELKYLGDLPVRALLEDAIIGRSPLRARESIHGQAKPSGKGGAGESAYERVIDAQQEEFQRLADIVDTLELWGVFTLHDFARLPESGVAERLGAEGARLQRLARGESDRQLLLIRDDPDFKKAIELDDPIELLEPLSFIFAHLINQLCADLKAQALAANELRLRLRLEDRTETERLLRLPFPMRDQKTFLRLLLLDLESHPPRASIVAVSLICEPARPQVIQNGLFHPLAPEPEKLELTIARIAKLVGSNNIGSPEILDAHRPDAFRIKHFNAFKKFSREWRLQAKTRGRLSDLKSKARKPEFVLGFRVFRPPLLARVEAPSGWPARINAQSRAPGRSIRGNVVRAAGPWRSSGDWWMADGWARDEWDVAIASSEALPDKQVLCRIYHDLRNDSWFVEGTYD